MFRCLGLIFVLASALTCSGQGRSPSSFLGFDRNVYPGDESLSELRQTFTYVGYWLNSPPGSTSNSWAGKRKVLRDAGFGFAILFNGKGYSELKSEQDPAAIGKRDAADAAKLAIREGFGKRAIIFLDIEEGGRLLPQQMRYVLAWVDELKERGFRPGVYCSGIDVQEADGSTINTARDIQQSANDRKITYWVSNDACPQSHGCAVPEKGQSPKDSGVLLASLWQYAQSPRRKFADTCRQTYAADGNCYVVKAAERRQLHLDLNISTSPDPSEGRRSK